MPETVDDYSDRLLNVILDAIDDIILIHDPDHTVIWMNKAGLDALDMKLDDVIGQRCYQIFGYSRKCGDCITPLAITEKRIEKTNKYLPTIGHNYDCTSIPVMDDKDNLILVVQHLRATSLK